MQLELTSNLIGEICVTYKTKEKAMKAVTSSKIAADFLRSIWSDRMEYVEEFRILLLNRANKIMGWALISSGGVCGTMVDAKVIFQAALLGNASGLILCHNHPSGNIRPSQADKDITRKLKSGSELLDIKVFDHVILTSDSYFSFADEGLI